MGCLVTNAMRELLTAPMGLGKAVRATEQRIGYASLPFWKE
jgi:hypothetical protein